MNNSNRSRRNMRIGGKRKRKPRRNNREPGAIKLVIEKGIGQFMPQEYRVRLVWPDTTYVRNNAGSTAANWKYQSSAFDPDSGAASGAIPGFTKLAAFYQAYRIRRMALRATVANLESFPLLVVMWPSMEANTLNALTVQQLREYSVNPQAVSQLVGPLTGATVSNEMHLTATTENVIGEDYIEADINLQSTVTGNPTLLWYLNLGLISQTNLVNGIFIDARMEIDVEFYRRVQLLG